MKIQLKSYCSIDIYNYIYKHSGFPFIECELLRYNNKKHYEMRIQLKWYSLTSPEPGSENTQDISGIYELYCFQLWPMKWDYVIGEVKIVIGCN